MSKQIKGLNRRGFLGGLGKISAGAFCFPAIWTSRSFSADPFADQKIKVALVGCGGMGNYHLDALTQRDDIEIIAVCDVYTPRYEAARKKVGGRCEGFQDYRRVLDIKEVDAVFFATPDHWHTLNAIHACQAWKDVYVEKPLSTTIYEGRQIVENARRYDRVVQVGLQQRSLDIFQQAVDLVHKGKLGQITSTGAWIGPNGILGYETPGEPPEGLDWDLWLGPAPWVPYSPQRFHGFRSFHDYAGGELTNWGPHLIDIVHWGIKKDYPLNVSAVGGSFRQLSGSDDYETMDIVYEYEGCTMTWKQAHNLEHHGKTYGTKFLGTAGKLFIDRNSFIVKPDSLGIPETKPGDYNWIDIKTHHDNFFECVRSRQTPHTDVEIGHRSTSACLLGNIALNCRRKLRWDGKAERFIDDEQANRYLYRPYRAPWHL